MIFLSHNSRNKNLVEPMYIDLLKEFPDTEIFYDDASIPPGVVLLEK